jgi:uncharacterized OB-fold protein
VTDLSQLKVPGPTITTLTAPFWAAADQGRLLIQRCHACGKAVFYPRGICPFCWSEDLHWEEASGEAALKSFSEVHKPGHPGWQPAVPYVVGLVRLREGPTMLSFVLGDAQARKVGDRLRLAPTNIGGRVLPAFRPMGLM